jgi:hypothetical protein
VAAKVIKEKKQRIKAGIKTQTKEGFLMCLMPPTPFISVNYC